MGKQGGYFRGAANFRIFARMAASFGAESFMTDTPDGLGAVNYVQQTPIGVVGVICPWNLPLLLMTWKVAPALAMGNTVVVKPSEETPATATLLGEVMKDVGIPDGVYNVVHGFGPDCVGEVLSHTPMWLPLHLPEKAEPAPPSWRKQQSH